MPGPVMELDLKIDGFNDDDAIKTLISTVKPEWPLDKLQTKLFNEGTSNVLFAVYTDLPLSTDNCVLVRIFGYQTELYIDRDHEAIYLWILNHLEFSEKVFIKFSNGICYGYQPGSTVKFDQLCQPKFYNLVAEKLAALHNLPIIEFARQQFADIGHLFDTSPSVLNSVLKFIGLISDNLLKKAALDGCGDTSAFPTKEYLIEEVLFLRKLLADAKSPVRYCHNDLLFGNILLSPEEDAIHFIDYEYCGFNHVCYDIANHFCEYTGMADHDVSRYPSVSLRRSWLTRYLRSFKKFSGVVDTAVTDQEVEEWLLEVEKFTLASHLYWGVWGIVQSQRSKINFDYSKYALTRLEEYKKLKSQLLLK